MIEDLLRFWKFYWSVTIEELVIATTVMNDVTT